jgi:hypothetical protein
MGAMNAMVFIETPHQVNVFFSVGGAGLELSCPLVTSAESVFPLSFCETAFTPWFCLNLDCRPVFITLYNQ